jgi:hypothetical protein
VGKKSRTNGFWSSVATKASIAPRSELRRALGDPVEDRDVLGQELAVIERQCRDIALGIDLVEVAAVRRTFRLQVDPDPVELEAGLVQRDMVGEAACPGVR